MFPFNDVIGYPLFLPQKSHLKGVNRVVFQSHDIPLNVTVDHKDMKGEKSPSTTIEWQILDKSLESIRKELRRATVSNRN